MLQAIGVLTLVVLTRRVDSQTRAVKIAVFVLADLN